MTLAAREEGMEGFVCIFTRDSFLSIVRHRTQPDHLLVRARDASDIRRIWPLADVEETREADYRFRTSLRREHVANAISTLVADIAYTTDFKGGVREDDRHNAYLKVWGVMQQWQERRRRGAGRDS